MPISRFAGSRQAVRCAARSVAGGESRRAADHSRRFLETLGAESPIPLILGLLAATIGLPYFVLSTTSPLIQAWFAREHPGRSPYRLFALSNLASMLALLGYPFLLEPWVATRVQAWGWSAGYVLFVALCIATARKGGTRAHASARQRGATEVEAIEDHRRRQNENLVPRDSAETPPTLARQALWCALAATSSVLLLAVTDHITQNIAAVPLLWILPLSLYLMTFILCFDGSGWYYRETIFAMLAAALGVMGWTLADPNLANVLGLQIAACCFGFFLACMFCHGELVTLKPAPRYLTRFYLMISLGGALGAIAAGVVAPLVFTANFDLVIALLACGMLLLWQTRREKLVFPALALLSLLFTAGCGVWGMIEFYRDTVYASRNFYGVLRVQDAGVEEVNRRRTLVHGTIMHGKQYLHPSFRNEPTSYYTRNSGIGRLLEAMHPRIDPIRVGVIGLGAGTLAVYGAKGDVYRFYDINPSVVAIAQRDFTFLRDSDATVEIVAG